MRIGICDDNQQILEEMDAVIQEWAAQTNRSDIMVNRFDAAEKLLFQIDGGQSFDAFFLDLRLPKMNGFVLGEIIREKDESVPIVFVTNSDDYLLRGYELQVIRYLKKPIQKEQVFQVMEIISKKHMEKENTFRMIRKDRMTEKLYYRDIRYVVSGIHSVKYAKTNGEMLIVVVVVAACAFLLHLSHSAKKQNPDISPLQQADNVYYSALHANEKYQRQIATIYGDNSEAKTLLEKLAAEIKAVQKVRNSNRLKLTMFLVGFTLIPLFLYIVGPTPRSRFETFRDEHKSSFNMSSYSKTLKPLPEHPIADSIANYLTVDSDAYLSFEIVKFGDYGNDYKDNLCIRLDHVKIGYKGDKIEHPDSCVLKAVLYDKNMKPMSDSLVSYTERYYFEDTPLYTILRRGRSHYYESFASKKTYGLIDSLRRIADSAYYYSIY